MNSTRQMLQPILNHGRRRFVRTLSAGLTLLAVGCLDSSKFDDTAEGGLPEADLEIGTRDSTPPPPPADTAFDASSPNDVSSPSGDGPLGASDGSVPGQDGSVPGEDSNVSVPSDAEPQPDARPDPTPDAATGPCTVNVTVTLPANTPPGDTLYIAGDFTALDWEAGLAEMALDRDGNQASKTLEIAPGPIKYKYTRGTWETGEKGAECAELPNRADVVGCPGGTSFEIRDTVATWADLCGD